MTRNDARAGQGVGVSGWRRSTVPASGGSFPWTLQGPIAIPGEFQAVAHGIGVCRVLTTVVEGVVDLAQPSYDVLEVGDGGVLGEVEHVRYQLGLVWFRDAGDRAAATSLNATTSWSLGSRSSSRWVAIEILKIGHALSSIAHLSSASVAVGRVIGRRLGEN